MITASQFKVWKTIKLGVCKTSGEYYKALESAGCDFGSCYKEQPEFDCAQQETEVDLVIVTPDELDYVADYPYRVILAMAVRCGLQVCPFEVGYALVLAHAHEPLGHGESGSVIIASEPVVDGSNRRSICDAFEFQGKRCLHFCRPIHEHTLMRQRDNLVFIRPRT